MELFTYYVVFKDVDRFEKVYFGDFDGCFDYVSFHRYDRRLLGCSDKAYFAIRDYETNETIDDYKVLDFSDKYNNYI